MKNHVFGKSGLLTYAFACGVFVMTLSSGPAWAVWCATSECSRCGSHGWSKREECRFDSQAACNSEIARVKREQSIAAAVYTCYEHGSGNSTSASGNEALIAKSTEGLVQGIMSGDANLTSMSVLGLGVASFLGMAQGDPKAEAKLKAETAAREVALEAERKRAEQQEIKKHEDMKNRLLGNMMDAGEPSQLGLMGVDSGPRLSLMTDDLQVRVAPGALGSTEVIPTGTGSPSAEQGLQLMLGDDAERSGMQARQGFDTKGKIKGGKVPPPPPTPKMSPVYKQLNLNILKIKLKKNEAEEQTLKDQLTKLQHAPKPDPLAISQVQEKIVAKETEKKKIMLDLTAEDPDASGADQASGNTGSTSGNTSAKGAPQ